MTTSHDEGDGSRVAHVWTPTRVVVDSGQQLQMRPEARQVGGVAGPLQDDGQLLDAFGKRLWRLELFQGRTAGGDEHVLATQDRAAIVSEQNRHTHSTLIHELRFYEPRIAQNRNIANKNW